jgi:AbrB family looped-hinge helix DNA binding protein
MRITSKGQVTIPQAIREESGLLPNTEVEFAIDGAAVRIMKARSVKRGSRGARAVARLRDRGGTVVMTTDEIMALTRD